MRYRSRLVRSRWLLVMMSPLILLACTGSAGTRTSTPPPMPTPTLAPGPTPLTGFLGPLPAQCQQTSPPDTRQFGPVDGFSSQFPVEGGGPAWLTSDLYDMHLEQGLGYQPLPSTKMLWALGPNNTQPVTITGQDLVSGTPMWVEVYGVTPPVTTAVLPPDQNNRGSGTMPDGTQWEIWGTGLIFLRAGCYQMTVRWPGGHWETTFAVGR